MNGRRRPLLAAALACLVIVVAVTLGLTRLYTASRDRLDEAMGQRLLAVARTVALTSDPARVFALSLADPDQAEWAVDTRRRLVAVAAASDLAEITLTDPDGRVLFSTSGHLPAGDPNDYWDLDREAVALACAGQSAVSSLYRLQTVYQKSAHAPVLLDDPLLGEGGTVVAVVTVSGNPDFFGALATLRRGAWATGAAVLLVLTVMGWVLYGQTLSLERYRESLLRQESLAAMGRMTAGIAHEIRNPLGIIRGTAEHLQMRLAEAGIEDPVAEFIPEEVDRLDRILSGYLAFGRDAEVEAEEFDLGMALRRGAGLLESELKAAGVALAIPAGLPAVKAWGDPRRLQQVLLNLLLNARDAMPDGGTVHLDLVRQDDRARILVADEGTGLAGDPEECFEPFRTTKEKGGGLGLALSRRIVEEMGGTLTLANRDGGAGALACLTLPSSERRD